MKAHKNSTISYVQLKIFEMAQFWQFYPLAHVHGFFAKNKLNLIYNFLTPFERAHFELSEKYKSFVIELL